MKRPNKAKKTRTHLLLSASITLLCLTFLWAWSGYRKARDERQLHNLGLDGAPPEIAERHLWITRNIPETPAVPGYIPVHIVYRVNSNTSWGFSGSGALVSKLPGNLVVTAYHVFEGRPGQYGWRKISRQELEGKEPVISIEGFSPTKLEVDDAVMCTSNPQGSFPILDLPMSTNKFVEFNPSNRYDARKFEQTLRFTTYPGKEIPAGFASEVKSNVQYIFFPWKAEQGESGTVGFCGGDTSRLFVLIRTYVMTEPELKKIGLPVDVPYTVTYCISLN